MAAAALRDAVRRVMPTLTLPGPLTASMALPPLKLSALSAIAALIVPEPPVPSIRKPSPEFWSMLSRRRSTLAAIAPLGLIRTPVTLPTIAVSRTNILTGLALPAPGDSVRPEAVKPSNTQFSTCRRAPLENTTPEVPLALAPLKTRPRKIMASPEPALMTMPLVPDAPSTPLGFASSLAMVSDWVTVTGPKSPGSSTSISPPLVVSASAAAKVRHGAPRVHGLVSLPSEAETQVRDIGDDPPGDENIAVTLVSEFIVIWQLPLPLQAPPQFIKLAPPLGVAVSVTCVPLEKSALQIDPQLIAPDVSVTAPLPETATLSG